MMMMMMAMKKPSSGSSSSKANYAQNALLPKKRAAPYALPPSVA